MEADREGDRRVRGWARYPSRLDLLGAAVVAMTALWALVAAANRAGEPAAFLLALSAAVGGYVLGRLLGVGSALPAPAMVAGAVAGMSVLWPGASSGDATAPPLHYGNANGALVAQAAGAACLAALAVASARWRRGILVLAALLVLATFATRSVAAAVGALAVLSAGLLSAAARRKGTVVLVSALCVVGVALGTVVLGVLGTRTGALEGAAEAGLTERRVQLWGEGAHLTKSLPVRGTGPGMFVTNSATASSDADVHSAHSLWLRQSAEQGVPGAVCLVALVGWVYVRLWRSPQPVAVVLVGSATFTAFLVQASIDYVAEFPAVLVAVGVLTGVATAGPDHRSRARSADGVS
ncbi:O-antigen ligase family protein [Embleya sp. NPDC005971]|uniref:O-antigen ligase family protein n=1 Tax=Embleya sp. NPDC005971 TaxID=3156724 RepID=UPI0033FC3CF5